MSVLLDEGLVEEADLMKAVARRLGIQYVDLSEVTVDPCRSSPGAGEPPQPILGRSPYAFDEGRLVVAMSGSGQRPRHRRRSGRIRTRCRPSSPLLVATSPKPARRAARFDDSVSDLAETWRLADEAAEVEDVGTLEEAAEDAPVVKLMNTIIARAVNERASDIHVEPGERDLRIRFRIDGVLHEVMTTSRSISNAVVSRDQDHGRPRHRRAPSTLKTAG